jgi:hypothetical protein
VEDDIDIDGDDQDTYGEAQFTEGDILPVDETLAAPLDEDVNVEIERDKTDDADAAQKSLRDLIAETKVIVRQATLGDSSGSNSPVVLPGRTPVSMDVEKIDSIIADARQKRNTKALITALEEKIQRLVRVSSMTKNSFGLTLLLQESIHVSSSTTLLCRICLEQYTEPTVSTGCWHTCCRECWLRCLGSTKLCPICKRITGATDLRRVYL